MYLKENKVKMNTADLFREVCKLLELDEGEYQDKIADFFQSLTTSKEFILLNDGNWDLKENHSVKIDMDDILEDNEIEEDAEIAEDNYEDDVYEDNLSDDVDDLSDDYDDLTIVDEDELDEEN